MAKRQIINLPGQPHFVTFSTYQRRQFLSTERARSIVLEVLESCLKAHGAKCHGFVVMPNHVHAIISVQHDAGITSFLHAWKKTSSYRIKRFYAQELTKYHDLCPVECPVWQSKFYDFILETDEKFTEKLEYMHNNPVAAKLVSTGIEWKWSSSRFYELGEESGVSIIPDR